MIGIFDSGLGGLTVFCEIRSRLPQYDYLYLGDTARVPYGNRSQEAIYRFSKQAADFLFDQGCELIIVACNTASAEALRKLQQEYLPDKHPERRMLGVIRPIVEEAARVSKSGRIAVLGTRATISSGAYDRELEQQKQGIKAFGQAAPLLVPLIEEGYHGKPASMRILRSYLRPLKQKYVDTLILGCTHYPILRKRIRDAMGTKCNVLDTSGIVADKLADYLERHPEIEERLSKNKTIRIVTTDKTERFDSLASRFFGSGVASEEVRLSN